MTFKLGDRRDRLVPAAPADPGPRVRPVRRLDRPARADRGAAPARRPRRRHHRLRVRVDLQPLRLRGDDHRDARHADPAGGRRRGEGAREAVREARDHAAARQAVHRRRAAGQLAARRVRRRRDGRVRPDARRRRSRRRSSRASGSRQPASQFDKRKGIATDEHRRTTVPHIYAVGDCAGYWQLAHTAFREGEVAAENALRPRRGRRQPRGAAPDLHRPGDRRRRAHRGAGARAVRRRCRRSASSRGSRTPGQ